MRSSFEEVPLLPRRDGFVAITNGTTSPGPMPSAEEPAAEGAEGATPGPVDEREEQRAAAIASAIEALTAAVQGWRVVESRELDAVRDAVVELGLTVARRVLERELDPLSEAFADHVHRALEELVEPSGAQIFLSPADLACIQESSEGALRNLEEEGSAQLYADPQLNPGDARVEAGDRQIDLRLDTILERFREALGNESAGEAP